MNLETWSLGIYFRAPAGPAQPWTPVVLFFFGSSLFVDCSNDDLHYVGQCHPPGNDCKSNKLNPDGNQGFETSVRNS